jgi:hypothetical protein
MMTLFGVLLGISPDKVQPARRKIHFENLLSKGLRSGVVKIVKRIQLHLKIIHQRYHQSHGKVPQEN